MTVVQILSSHRGCSDGDAAGINLNTLYRTALEDAISDGASDAMHAY